MDRDYKEGYSRMENLEQHVKKYFNNFSDKNLKELSKMFSENISLQDWETLAKGKSEVLDANKNIFDSVDSISVTLNQFYQDGLVAICLIDINVNQEEILKVIDIIKFDNDQKIIEVSAYKQ